MIDILWIAVSGVSYGQSEGDEFDSWTLDYIIDTHPCDDLPYVADIRPWPTAHIDGEAGSG